MKHLITLLSLFMLQSQFGQTFLIPKENIFTPDSVFQLENKRNSLYFNKASSHQDNESSKMVFLIDKTESPSLSIQYHYQNKHQIDHIIYKWDDAFFNGNSLEKTNEKQQIDLIVKYQKIVAELTQMYGQATQEGNLDDLKKVDDIFGLYRTDSWEHSNYRIIATIQISNYVRQNAHETIFPVFKIEVQFEYKQKNERNMNLSEYDSIFNSFVAHVGKKNYNNARNFFSYKVINFISDDYLKKIRSQIDNKKQYEIYATSKQLMSDGSENQIIQFKYSNDNYDDPLAFISVVFEKNGKILGVNPIRLGE